MLIKSNMTRVLFLSDPRPPNAPADQKRAQSIVIKPGINNFPDAGYAHYSKHPDIKAYIAEGVLEVITQPSKGEELSEAAEAHEAGDIQPSDSIAGMDSKKAVALVKQTFDLALLNAWLQTEKRSNVRKAIEAQAEQMKIGGK